MNRSLCSHELLLVSGVSWGKDAPSLLIEARKYRRAQLLEEMKKRDR